MDWDDYRELEPETFLRSGDYDEQGNYTDVLHSKWLGFYLNEKKTLAQMQMAHKVVMHERTNFYLGRCPKPYTIIVGKVDLPQYLDADPEIQKSLLTLGEQEDLVFYLKEVLHRINQRRFTVTNNIKWQKFIHGLND